MTSLKKPNLDKLFKNIIVKSENITIVETYTKRCEFISKLTIFFSSNDLKHYFSINTKNLEEEIDKCKQSFLKNRINNDHYYYRRYGSQTEEEYIQEKLYSNEYGSQLSTFFLEKYQPTQRISDEVLLCELNLTYQTKSKIFFAIFFNESFQLCFDYITVKKRKWNSLVNLESDIEISSAITDLDAIKKLLNSFPEEISKIEKEEEIRRQKNNKNRVKKEKIKALSSKAIIAKIKSILNEKGISFFIDERIHIIHIYLKMKKGKTVLRVPKKDIKTRIEILPSLCEKIIEADQLNIQCKYNQNM
ncbi:hypothetical protein MHK_006158 [Candidatus Magnetomorum sp. HK-1]|nr:hypothetical protein MHK_006158 [Candidatus Magnetomorum sp. HK-1]